METADYNSSETAQQEADEPNLKLGVFAFSMVAIGAFLLMLGLNNFDSLMIVFTVLGPLIALPGIVVGIVASITSRGRDGLAIMAAIVPFIAFFVFMFA